MMSTTLQGDPGPAQGPPGPAPAGRQAGLVPVLSGFGNFAIAMSTICVLAGGITSLHVGLCGVGGASVGIGWALGCLLASTAHGYSTGTKNLQTLSELVNELDKLQLALLATPTAGALLDVTPKFASAPEWRIAALRSVIPLISNYADKQWYQAELNALTATPPDESLTQLASEAMMRDAGFEAVPVAQIVVDRDGTLALANLQARAFFGISQREIGRPFEDLEISFRPVELRSRIEQVYSERHVIALRDVEWRTGGDIRRRCLRHES